MKVKRAITIILRMLILLVQYAIFIGAFVLEYLSHEKMGVARYLLYKKTEFAGTFFTPKFVLAYELFFVAGIILSFILMFKIRNTHRKVSAIFPATFLNAIGIVLLIFPPELAAYHFFVIATMVAIVVQYGKIGIGLANKSK